MTLIRGRGWAILHVRSRFQKPRPIIDELQCRPHQANHELFRSRSYDSWVSCIWEAAVGEELQCATVTENVHDLFAVAVLRAAAIQEDGTTLERGFGRLCLRNATKPYLANTLKRSDCLT